MTHTTVRRVLRRSREQGIQYETKGKPRGRKPGAQWTLDDRRGLTEGGVNVEKLLAFLDARIRDAHHKVFLILDTLKVHHSKLVSKWVEARKDKIELVFSPAYSPDVNPDEHLNADLKQGIGSKVPVR